MPEHDDERSSASAPRQARRDFRTMLALVSAQRSQLAGIALLSLAAAGASLAQPVVVAVSIESISSGDLFAPMIWLLGGLLLLSTVLSGIQQYLLQRMGESVVLEARRGLIRRLLRLRMPEYDRRSVGDIVSRVNSDTTVLRSALIQATVTAFGGIVTIVGASIAMGVINWQLLIITIGIVMISLVAVLTLSRLVTGASAKMQEEIAGLTTVLERALRGIRTVRASNATHHEELRLEAHAVRSWRTGVRSAKYLSVISPVSGLFTQISLLTVLGVGGYLVSTGTMSIADLVAFMLFLVMLVVPLGQAFTAIGTFGQALGAFGRISELMRLPTEEHIQPAVAPECDAALVADCAVAISFQDVSFSYDGDSTDDAPSSPVLASVSFDVPRGRRVAVVGPSGAGKSTILQLVERFYEPTAGTIRIFGRDAADLDPAVLRELIGYVEQDSPALGGSLRSNLTMTKPDATDAECISALEQVNLAGLLERSSAGLDGEIGDSGVMLSGGERQRLAIARALLGAPPILLLDESTSSLDSQNETQMRHAVDSVASGRSLVVIAHRLATVIDSDEIIVLDRGRVIGRGRHDELLESTPLYRSLAENQLLAS